MSMNLTFKAGFFDFGYIKNRRVRSMRRGDQGRFISSAAALVAKLHYDQYRPHEVVNDTQPTSEQRSSTTDSSPASEPESELADKLGYDQYRPEFDRMSRQKFPNRPIIDYELGADEVEIIDNCKRWANPYAIAYSYIISLHPLFIVILREHGIDAEKFTETYAVAFIHNFLESVGCEVTIEMSMVIHYVETTTGLPHIHAHVTTPGTGYDEVTHTRVPVPKITPEMLSEGQAIADRTAEREMDRVLTRAWRLEVPELAGTFYDPIDLPIPEPSSELDAWFPRPKIPAIALSSQPEIATLGDILFPKGIWEAPTHFGEPSELAEVVDKLFADVTFEPTLNAPLKILLFEPASASIETDEREATTPPSQSDRLAKTLKLIETPLEAESSLEGLASVVNGAQNSPIITPESNAAFIVVDESYPPNESDENESVEVIVEHLWPRLMRPDSADLDSQSVDIAALIDALFPASFWESADGFGDEDIARQIDELFPADELAARSVTESDGIHFSRSTGETGLLLVEVSSEPVAESPTELEPELDYPWRHFEATGGQQLDYRIIPAWDADLSEGHLTLALAWYEPGVQERSTVQTTIFHNTPLDYLHLDEGPADLTAAQHEAKARFEEKAALYQALPENDFSEFMHRSFEDWMCTTALDEAAQSEGFLADFPQNLLPFDPDEESGYVDPLPVGVTWLGPAETDENALRWGIVTRPDREGGLRVYALKQWLDEHEISRFTSSEIGLAAETIDGQITLITSVQQTSVKLLGPTLSALQRESEAFGHPSIDFLADGPPHSSATSSQPDQSLPSESERFDEDEIGENELDEDEQSLELDEWDME